MRGQVGQPILRGPATQMACNGYGTVWRKVERPVMRKNKGWSRRIGMKLAVIGGAGVLVASGDLSCASFGLNNALSSTNFCFLLNCNDGALGGLIDFCAPTQVFSFVGGRNADAVGTTPFLSDCPNQ